MKTNCNLSEIEVMCYLANVLREGVIFKIKERIEWVNLSLLIFKVGL
jgi:hypothetical protein